MTEQDHGATAGARSLSAALPCVVCGRELENVVKEGNQPYGGLAFRTQGHYGSSVFDPPGWFPSPEFLTVSICDDCVCVLADSGRLLRGVVAERLTTTYGPFGDPLQTIERHSARHPRTESA